MPPKTGWRESISLHLSSLTKNLVKDFRVDVMIDSQVVMHAWNNQEGQGRDLYDAMRVLFFTNMATIIRWTPILANCHT